MAVGYAVGDVWALVPARKAVWSSTGEPKASWNTFFLSSFFYLYSRYSSIFWIVLVYYVLFISYLFLILLVFLTILGKTERKNFLVFIFLLRYHPESKPLSNGQTHDASAYRCSYYKLVIPEIITV